MARSSAKFQCSPRQRVSRSGRSHIVALNSIHLRFDAQMAEIRSRLPSVPLVATVDRKAADPVLLPIFGFVGSATAAPRALSPPLGRSFFPQRPPQNTAVDVFP